jgi:hypothetical protein
MQFHLGVTGDSTTTTLEKMRLTANGRLGIGTTSPQSRLHVTDTSVAQFYLQNSTYRWSMSTLSNQLRFFNDVGTNGEISFEPNAASPQLRIDGNGVGIGGPASASQILTVNGSANISATMTANSVQAASVTATTGNVAASAGDVVVSTVGGKGFQIGGDPTSNIGTKLFMDTSADNKTVLAARSTTTNGSLDLCWNRLSDGVTGNTVRLSIANTVTCNGRLILSGNRISNVGNATQGGDAVSRDFGDGRYVSIADPNTITGAKTFSQPITMSSVKITGLAAGTVASDAVRYDQLTGVDAGCVHIAGTETITGSKTFNASTTFNALVNRADASFREGECVRAYFPTITAVNLSVAKDLDYTTIFKFSYTATLATNRRTKFTINSQYYVGGSSSLGSAGDRIQVRLRHTSTTAVIWVNTQGWQNAGGGGTRTGTLFPIILSRFNALEGEYTVDIRTIDSDDAFYLENYNDDTRSIEVILEEYKSTA